MSWAMELRVSAGALGVIALISVAGANFGVPGAERTTRIADTSGTGASITYQVSRAAQHEALAYWTTDQMSDTVTAVQREPQVTAPTGTPTATKFSGSPTVGTLFYTTGGKSHFCSASVVDSPAEDLVITAAHCAYNKSFSANIEYVPEYHNGKRPYGAWPVRTITVASGWERSHNPDLDFAFLAVGTANESRIQARTGGLTIRFTQWYTQKIEVIGHNDADSEPIRCATKSFRFRTGQMEFDCHGFWTGTSGGPWVIGYNAKTGSGTLFGVIGGYEDGGHYEWASYSAYFGSAARTLYQHAETQPKPSPSASPSMSWSRLETLAPQLVF